MFTEEDQNYLNELCDIHPELSKLLKKKEEEYHSILSGITHEMRNPLTLIYSTMQLMEKQNPELIQLKYWKQLAADIKDLTFLLEEFSSFNHSMNTRPEIINISSLLKDIILSFQAISFEKKVNLSFNIIGNPDKRLFEYPGDPLKLKQVFINLIKNALEACQARNYVRIEINADPSLLATNINGTIYMQISISDNGEPIPHENLNDVFVPFFTNKSMGTGLGLPIAKKIILAHHGDIVVSSTKKKTTFCVNLPLYIDTTLSAVEDNQANIK